jgi:hypothetical protein
MEMNVWLHGVTPRLGLRDICVLDPVHTIWRNISRDVLGLTTDGLHYLIENLMRILPAIMTQDPFRVGECKNVRILRDCLPIWPEQRVL